MTATNSSDKSLSFSIEYGFLGGPLHGKKLSRRLREAGYKPTKKHENCDIVIAHSTGTWRLPSKVRLVIYVDVPLLQKRPGRTYISAALKDIRGCMHWGAVMPGLRFLLLSLFYAIVNPRRNVQLVKTGSSGRPKVIPGVPTIYIANKDDPWQRSEQLQEYIQQKNWTFLSLEGGHNDIWIHPEKYAEIADHYAKLLA